MINQLGSWNSTGGIYAPAANAQSEQVQQEAFGVRT